MCVIIGIYLFVSLYALVFGLIHSTYKDTKPWNTYCKRIFFIYGIAHHIGCFLFKELE